jgi:hypothetical protein
MVLVFISMVILSPESQGFVAAFFSLWAMLSNTLLLDIVT